ncbi:MAG: type IV pili methyl-accepting chemotaxis transducer N-terminal domain-containing protein, partial [Telluria sp.]
MTFDSLIPSRHKLSTKIVGALVGFLSLALVAISFTLYLSWQLEGSSAAINDAGSLRMNSFRLSNMLLRAADGDVKAREAATAQVAAIASTLAQLQQGDPARPLLLPPTQVIHRDFNQLTSHWHYQLRPAALRLLGLHGEARQQALDTFVRDTEAFVGQADALVRLIERDSETRTFWLRASQLALLALALAGTVSLVYLMVSMIIVPVRNLQNGMSRMTEKDFEVRLPVHSADEFGQLAHGF